MSAIIAEASVALIRLSLKLFQFRVPCIHASTKDPATPTAADSVAVA